MTEQTPHDTDAPDPEPIADEPHRRRAARRCAARGEGAPGASRGGEWMAQLEAMIAQISTQAAPVARQVGAKAAELAAVAAVKAGPAAQRAAEFTTEYGQRFAEKAQSVATELRSQDAVDGAAAEAAPDRRRRGRPSADAPDAPTRPAPSHAGATRSRGRGARRTAVTST